MNPAIFGNRALTVKHLARVAALILLIAVWTYLYAWINAIGVRSPRAATFTPPLVRAPWLFQPWAGAIYVIGGGVCFFLPFVWHWAGRRFARIYIGYWIVTGLAFSAYLVWPMKIVRPDYEGPGLGLWFMRRFTSFDEASNLNPSFHTIIAVFCILYMRDSRAPGWIKTTASILALSVCASTILVGQHYYGDLIGGAAAALAAYFAARAVIRDRGT